LVTLTRTFNDAIGLLMLAAGLLLPGCGQSPAAKATPAGDRSAKTKAAQGPTAGIAARMPARRASVRPPCSAEYARLLAPLDIAQACRYAGPAPVHFRDPWGCAYLYPGKGTAVITESPSYWKLRKSSRSAQLLRLPSGSAFYRKTRDGRASTVVLRLKGGRALLLQAPVRLCRPPALKRLASVVALRVSRKARQTFK
jgi:hypothetical protein